MKIMAGGKIYGEKAKLKAQQQWRWRSISARVTTAAAAAAKRRGGGRRRRGGNQAKLAAASAP